MRTIQYYSPDYSNSRQDFEVTPERIRWLGLFSPFGIYRAWWKDDGPNSEVVCSMTIVLHDGLVLQCPKNGWPIYFRADQSGQIVALSTLQSMRKVILNGIDKHWQSYDTSLNVLCMNTSWFDIYKRLKPRFRPLFGSSSTWGIRKGKFKSNILSQMKRISMAVMPTP